MKNLFKSIAALALVATMFTSCSKDGSDTPTSSDPGAPTLTVTAPTSDLNLRFKDVFTTKFSASPASGAKLKSILVTRTNLTSNILRKIYGDSSTIADSSTISRTVNDSISPEDHNVNDVIAYTIIITDNKGKSSSKTYNVTVKDLYVLCLKMEAFFQLNLLKILDFTQEEIKSILDNNDRLRKKLKKIE
jgi:hypothetical protein